ncbi:toll/interleukin-1 receptor domain-containing protein [Streptomyces sp. NPDC127068]|uniref:toll/interleukin-1 receptor domain-containing protein n=1 Tax=Streptomyces sp. NPDC127068 TaxID=3347127 RepID=UPI0036588D8F
MARIFINYRTGDGEKAPELVDERLVKVFGKGRVFRDRRSMRPGTDFPDHLREKLENCTVLLALIGRNWLGIRDDVTGSRRIDVPNDYVHDEIKTALDLNKIVIPVLLDAKIPTPDELPPSIAGLGFRQAIHLREGYAHFDLDAIVEELRQYVPEKKSVKKSVKKSAKKAAKKAGPTGQTGREGQERNGGGTDPGAVFDMGFDNTYTIKRSAFGNNPRYLEADPRYGRGNGAQSE